MAPAFRHQYQLVLGHRGMCWGVWSQLICVFTYQCGCPKIFRVSPLQQMLSGLNVSPARGHLQHHWTTDCEPARNLWPGAPVPLCMRIPPGHGRVLGLSAGQARSVRKLTPLKVISATEKWELGSSNSQLPHLSLCQLWDMFYTAPQKVLRDHRPTFSRLFPSNLPRKTSSLTIWIYIL